MNRRCRPVLAFAVLTISLFIVVSFSPFCFPQDTSGDISELKNELKQLRDKCDAYEQRIDALEKKLAETQAAPQAFMAAQEPQAQPPADEQKIAKNKFDLLPEYLTRGLEFTGYFRSGYGINSRGGKMEAFKAPQAPAKYRLGNEQETYIEAILTQNNWNPSPGGPKFGTSIRVAYQTQQNQSWDDTNQFVLREMYAWMSDFVASDPDLTVWGGERFYRLPELDINDFWWYDLSGYGGGFQNIDFFNLGQLDIAYIGFSSNDLTISTNKGRLAKNNLNFMLKDVDVPLGKGTFWVNGGYMEGGDYNGVEYSDAGGVDVGLMHQSTFGNSRNQLSLQYGYGVNSSLSAGANTPTTSDNADSWITRLTDMYNVDITDRLSMQAVGVLQYMDKGSDYDADQTWVSFGLRPVYGLTKYLAIEVEPGIDFVNDQQEKVNSYLLKGTVALRLSPGPKFDSVPRFRLFATYAHWGNDFVGKVGGGEGFADKKNGMNFGVQCEHWW